jgi:hypothetical protein
MRSIKTFEGFDGPNDRKDPKPRPEKKREVKRCIGQCKRQLFMKDGKPVLHCPSCDRIFEV